MDVVDSGAITNMTNKCNNIRYFRKLDTKFSMAKANETMIAKGSGIIKFQNYKLKEVVYIRCSKKKSIIFPFNFM